ncbi:MAG: YgaP family membrane protein [Spirochaetota bacterium]
MKKNMHIIDRILRTLLAVTIGVLYLADMISGTAAVILGLIAVIFLITSAVGFCPLYLALPFTKEQKK